VRKVLGQDLRRFAFFGLFCVSLIKRRNHIYNKSHLKEYLWPLSAADSLQEQKGCPGSFKKDPSIDSAHNLCWRDDDDVTTTT